MIIDPMIPISFYYVKFNNISVSGCEITKKMWNKVRLNKKSAKYLQIYRKVLIFAVFSINKKRR